MARRLSPRTSSETLEAEWPEGVGEDGADGVAAEAATGNAQENPKFSPPGAISEVAQGHVGAYVRGGG